MGNQNTKTELSKFLKVVFQKLWQWEQEVERSKKAKTHYIATIGWKGMAAILQYSATVKIARLGAELLGRSMENRKEGLLFGLTKRPMIESYTKGIWFECVADENQAKKFLSRSKRDKEAGWNTLKSEQVTPSLDKMWNVLKERNVMSETVNWMRGKRDWWNDSTHLGARSVLMGWSNENGKIIHNDEQIRNDIAALIEIGAQCAGHIHTMSEGGEESAKEQCIHKEKEQLRSML